MKVLSQKYPQKSILVGDLNIAPLPEDVWDHKKMAKVVSHTQVEVDHLDAVKRAGDWIDVTRKDFPNQKLYSWWSYRAKDWSAADRGGGWIIFGLPLILLHVLAVAGY